MVDEVCVSNAHSVGVGNDERRYCDCDVSSRKLIRVRKIKNPIVHYLLLLAQIGARERNRTASKIVHST